MMLSKKHLWVLSQDFAPGPVLSLHPSAHFKASSKQNVSTNKKQETSKQDVPEKQHSPLHQITAHLNDLYQELCHFEGCDLKKLATHTVFADGQANARIMAVGEAPGADEDREGRPFVGMSGQLLDKCFDAIGVSRRSNLYITNVIPWRPPGNRPPTAFEIAQCLPFLYRHICLIKPEIIIIVGGTAVKALIGNQKGIAQLRGKWINLTIPGLKKPVSALPIYHPAYLLRSPAQKAKTWADMLKIKRALEGVYTQ